MSSTRFICFWATAHKNSKIKQKNNMYITCYPSSSNWPFTDFMHCQAMFQQSLVHYRICVSSGQVFYCYLLFILLLLYLIFSTGMGRMELVLKQQPMSISDLYRPLLTELWISRVSPQELWHPLEFWQLLSRSTADISFPLGVIFCPGWTNIHDGLFSIPFLTLTLITLALTLIPILSLTLIITQILLTLTLTLIVTLIVTILTITIHRGRKIAWSRSNYPSLGTENIIYVSFL